jgi:ribonuclease-3
MNPADPTRLDAARRAIGFAFQDGLLVAQALRHASVGGVDGSDNERLEFLGDAAIGLAAAAIVYEKYPNDSEGGLTERRARMVSRTSLAAVARRIGLESLIETRLNGDGGIRLPDSVLAGTFEALIGAVLLEAGYDTAREVAKALLPDEPEIDAFNNAKSALQHLCQVKIGCVPNYRLLEERIHPFGRSFCVVAEARGRRFPPAWGRSKREAEQLAAREAILELGQEPDPEP